METCVAIEGWVSHLVLAMSKEPSFTQSIPLCPHNKVEYPLRWMEGWMNHNTLPGDAVHQPTLPYKNLMNSSVCGVKAVFFVIVKQNMRGILRVG